MYMEDGNMMKKETAGLSKEIEYLEEKFNVTLYPLEKFIGIEILKDKDNSFFPLVKSA